MLVTLLPVASQPAAAQGSSVPVEVWSIGEDTTWKVRQSCLGDNGFPDTVICDTPIGSRDAADPALNDAGWRDIVAWGPGVEANVPGFSYDVSVGSQARHGNFVATHFRRDFQLQQAISNTDQIVGLRVEVIYDDAAVIYLNGQEVYRTIRGNLDPTYSQYPVNGNIPYDYSVPFGGEEPQNGLVQIPNWGGQNECEDPDGAVGDCALSPYVTGANPATGNNPPTIPISLLDANGNGEIEPTEVQNLSVTVWNRNGSTDISFDLGLALLVDPNAVAPRRVQINEVVAKNIDSWRVQLDADPELESPDWIELYNFSNAFAVDVSGWKLSDDSNSIYTIPPTAPIPPNGRLLLAATDCKPEQGEVCNGSPLQTNFKLGSGGDSLRLTRTDSVVEDEVVLPEAIIDDSYGRPFDSGAFAYLPNTTPGAANGAAGTNYPPVIREFSDRLLNLGDPVNADIDAFDPDGNPLTYLMTGVPGLSVNSSTGAITGTATSAGVYPRVISVADTDGISTEPVTWNVIAVAPGGTRMALNEYNAVRDDESLVSGDGGVGNGGDWYEFLIIEDGLDIRGWTIELWDRKGSNDVGADNLLRQAAVLTFADRPELAAIPAGVLLVIRENDGSNDLRIDGVNDWTMELRVDAAGNGPFFEPGPTDQIFNSTRKDQMVLIRNAIGLPMAPLSGETEAWDGFNGGVSSQEVMNLCTNPVAGAAVDPVADYKDNGVDSTPGEENNCTWTEDVDPNDPNAGVITRTFDQDLSALRATATFVPRGDVDCDNEVTLLDARKVARFAINSEADQGRCLPLTPALTGLDALSGDVDGDGATTLLDARLIAQCSIGTPNVACPNG